MSCAEKLKLGYHLSTISFMQSSQWCSRPWGLSWSELPCPSVSGSVCGQTGSSVGAVYHAVFHVNIWKKVICHSYLMTGKHQILWTCVPNGDIDAVYILQSWIYVIDFIFIFSGLLGPTTLSLNTSATPNSLLNALNSSVSPLQSPSSGTPSPTLWAPPLGNTSSATGQ